MLRCKPDCGRNSAEQAENSKSTSEHMRLMGENITETSAEVEALNSNAEFMLNPVKKQQKRIYLV